MQFNAKPMQANANPVQTNTQPMQANAEPMQTNANTEIPNQLWYRPNRPSATLFSEFHHTQITLFINNCLHYLFVSSLKKIRPQDHHHDLRPFQKINEASFAAELQMFTTFNLTDFQYVRMCFYSKNCVHDFKIWCCFRLVICEISYCCTLIEICFLFIQNFKYLFSEPILLLHSKFSNMCNQFIYFIREEIWK